MRPDGRSGRVLHASPLQPKDRHMIEYIIQTIWDDLLVEHVPSHDLYLGLLFMR